MIRLLYFFFLIIHFVCSAQSEAVKFNDSIKITFIKAKLNSQELNKIKKDRIIFGNDIEKPISKLLKVELTINDKTYNLESNNMYNPWIGDSFDATKFKLKYSNGIYTVLGLFSDGAGTYITEWKISKYETIRSLISNDEEMLINYYSNF